MKREPAHGLKRWFLPGASRRPAFTLVEVLVVIAVIAVLAGLLLPVLASAREEGYRITCMAHLRQLSLAHQLYLRDWDERYVYWYVAAPPRPEPFGRRLFWTEYLQPYLRCGPILRDPSARGGKPEPEWLADYALATWGPGGRGTPDEPYFRWPGPPLSLWQVPRPSETIQWVDGRCATDGATIDGWSEQGQARGEYRHGRGNNAVFVDGHARWLAAEEMRRVAADDRGSYLLYGTADR